MRTIALLLCLAPLCAPAYAYYSEDFNEYPPSKPYGNDPYEAEQYRNEVEAYVRRAKEFIEEAESDARQAIEAAEEARDKANRAIEEYNDWVNYGY